MRRRLLALLLLVPLLLGARTWTWDPTPTAVGYRLYWVITSLDILWEDLDGDGVAENMVYTVPTVYPSWNTCDKVEVVGAVETPDTLPNPLPQQLVFVTATAFNEAGESGTGWGEGTTHGPISPCVVPMRCPEYPTFPCFKEMR